MRRLAIQGGVYSLKRRVSPGNLPLYERLRWRKSLSPEQGFHSAAPLLPDLRSPSPNTLQVRGFLRSSTRGKLSRAIPYALVHEGLLDNETAGYGGGSFSEPQILTQFHDC